VVLIFLVFCVVVFGGGPVVLFFLVFCVVVFGGVRGEHHGPHQITQHRKLKR
jgi:energy-coupling factor transporter transmembrane protein EcfT